MGRTTLKFDWDTARVSQGILLVECHDGSPILAKISQAVMDGVGRDTPADRLAGIGGMRPWIEGAIRKRYRVTIGHAQSGRQAPDGIRILTIVRDDFA
ncbi:hypothetical protein BH10PSE12_BH10PSE12_25090 [soil metagenome]